MNEYVRNDILSTTLSRAAFIHRHTVSFEETNLVGNVYYVRHVAWQGRCREMFLNEHAPSILNDLARDLRLVTLSVSCDYFEEIRVFDQIEIQMRLAHLRQNKIGLNFAYLLHRDGHKRLAAYGFQEIGCMRATDRGLAPTPIPSAILTALGPFGANDHRNRCNFGSEAHHSGNATQHEGR